MSLSFKYQIVVIDAADNGLGAIVADTIRKRVADLGLTPDDDIRLFDLSDASQIDSDRAPTAAVFFGASRRSMETDEAVEELRRRGVFVLPVVPTLTDYSASVPECLHPVNGKMLDAADPSLEAVAQRLLEELRLVRDKRLLFISYKRSEAGGVAEQLYRVFDERSFDVFLDTHSVRGGLEFQSVLWDQIADADLLVLLDTPGALTSRWVAQELARAHALGLGVLQLIWPGHQRSLGTDFCHPLYLKESDFDRSDASIGRNVRLRDDVLRHVATAAESLRARSIAARRARIIGELYRRATDAGFEVVIGVDAFVEVRPSNRTPARVFPVVGHPDSQQIHCCHDGCNGTKMGGVLLYDPLGMLPRKSDHLTWLNGYLPLRVLPVHDVADWLDGLR